MQIKHVETFDDFLKLGARDWHPIHRWIYRGVPDAAFGMRPVIGRNPVKREGKLDTGRLLDDERQLLSEFKRKASAYSTAVPVGDLDWLCIGRHYGLATRLLDMTSNPLIALFFAAYPDSNTDFAIYRYWFSSWLEDQHSMDLKTLQRQKESMPLYPRLTAERFVRQSSVMLVCHKPWEDFDFSLAPENLTKIVFPAAIRNKIRHQLSVLGITPSFVRPDLDGLCQELNDNVIHRKKFWSSLPPLEGEELTQYEEFRTAMAPLVKRNKAKTERVGIGKQSKLALRSRQSTK